MVFRRIAPRHYLALAVHVVTAQNHIHPLQSSPFISPIIKEVPDDPSDVHLQHVLLLELRGSRPNNDRFVAGLGHVLLQSLASSGVESLFSAELCRLLPICEPLEQPEVLLKRRRTRWFYVTQ